MPEPGNIEGATAVLEKPNEISSLPKSQLEIAIKSESIEPQLRKETRHSKEYHTDYEFYEFNLPTGEPVRVLFKTREELPDPLAVEDRHVVHIGNKPLWESENSYLTWIDSFNGQERAQFEHRRESTDLQRYAREGGLTLIVDQNPQSILEAALILGASNPRIREMLKDAKSFRYSEEIIQLIDKAIAAKRKNPDSHDSEALLIKDLLGNEVPGAYLTKVSQDYQAETSLDMAKVREEQSKRFNDWMTEWRKKEKSPFPLEDLTVVRVTKFYPVFDEKRQRWVIPTFLSSSEGKYPRSTLHFTLNHVVESHMEGNFDENDVVIVAPLSKMIEENGLPESMAAVDTWWNLNPGQELVLPEDTIVLTPGRTNGEDVAQGSTTQLRHRGPERGLIRMNFPIPNINGLEELRMKLNEQDRTGDYSNYTRLAEEFNQKVKEITDKRNKAVERVIREQGIPVKVANQHGWTGDLGATGSYGDPDNKRLAILAEQLGTEAGWHAGSMGALIEQRSVDAMRRIGESGPKLYRLGIDQFRGEVIDRFWGDLPPQQRRTLWVTGLL